MTNCKIPFFIMLFLLVVETSFVFYGQSRMQSLAQDASRRFSVGMFGSNINAAENLAENYILNRMKIIGEGETSDAVAIVGVENGYIVTQIGVPAGELDVIGTFGFIQNMSISVYAQQFLEFNQ